MFGEAQGGREVVLCRNLVGYVVKHIISGQYTFRFRSLGREHYYSVR
jgi:hypothetical protein